MPESDERDERDEAEVERPSPLPSPFPMRSPLDGAKLSPVDETPLGKIPGIVKRARTAQAAWADTPLADRVDAIVKVKRRVLERAEEIAALLRAECGKPLAEAALSEVLPNADLVDWWCANVEELLEPAPVELDPVSYPGKSGQITKAPRGVLGLVTPWNFPVAIPLRAIVPALLAGNAVVFKPSEITPRAGALVASLFDGLLPSGLLAVVQGGGAHGQAIIEAGVDVVSFTGSVATGRKVAVACAERLVPCALELGGKDAAVVLRDADLERAARGIVWGAFMNAGQNCASIERVYVEREVAQPFLDRVVALTKTLRLGDDVGSITTRRQADVVRAHVEQALESGAELLAGGPPDDPADLLFPPTVLQVTDEDTPLLTEETFGPVLPVVVVDGVDEAIARVNASKYGLTTSLWTRKSGHAHELAKRLATGVVTINNHGFTAALPMAPWVGTGESGTGVTNSAFTLHELTRPRFVLEDKNRAKAELWWYPYTPVLRTIAFAMARARGGAGLFGRLQAVFALLAALPKRLLGGG